MSVATHEANINNKYFPWILRYLQSQLSGRELMFNNVEHSGQMNEILLFTPENKRSVRQDDVEDNV